MSTVNRDEKATSVISNDAYELFGCFVDGLDDAVYDIAKGIAREQGRLTDDGLISIEIEDVRQAAELLLEGLRQQVESDGLSLEVIDQMGGCLDSKLN